MEYLKKFSPAEVLLLTKNRQVHLIHYMQATLMDLLAKEALKTEQLIGGDGQTITYVFPGPGFSTYASSDHERLFLDPFRSNNDRILFPKLVRLSMENVGSTQRFVKLLLKNPNLQGCFESGFRTWFKTEPVLTLRGKELASHLMSEIEELGHTLPSEIARDPSKLKAVAKEIKGNVCLIPGIDFKSLREIDFAKTQSYGMANTADSWVMDLILWHSLTSSFNSHTVVGNWHGDSGDAWSDNAESNAGNDSGCSGDSGCSSCGSD